jgi:hypothetical protein
VACVVLYAPRELWASPPIGCGRYEEHQGQRHPHVAPDPRLASQRVPPDQPLRPGVHPLGGRPPPVQPAHPRVSTAPERFIHVEASCTSFLVLPLGYDRPALQLLLYESSQPFAAVMVVRHVPPGVRKPHPGLGGDQLEVPFLVLVRRGHQVGLRHLAVPVVAAVTLVAEEERSPPPSPDPRLRVNEAWPTAKADVLVSDGEAGLVNAVDAERRQLCILHAIKHLQFTLWREKMSPDERHEASEAMRHALFPLVYSARKHLEDGDGVKLRAMIEWTLGELRDVACRLRGRGYPKAAGFIERNARFMVTLAELALEGVKVPHRRTA